MDKIYFICPVRNASVAQVGAMNRYVEALEEDGHTVHYPPRDVDQRNDDGGVRIVQLHLQAMLDCDVVHIWWDVKSTGSHFDLGMACMLDLLRRQKGLPPLGFFLANGTTMVKDKCYTNFVRRMVQNSRKHREMPASPPPAPPASEEFLIHLQPIAQEDAAGLKKAFESYGPSWKQRGGVGAFMMLARKWDRLENRVKKLGWDIFRAITEDTRGEGAIDDVRDLRRYLLLVESEMRAQGFERTHRDNSATA